ncbi:hypothetical protein [Streptomyces rishiriensis]|uniref:hypothetical protein n=1 Tax=Streptomyces rishiriensis TaxID=68264 RepID=UPI000D596488|nr:hypothetical protein [Streptomyces rishiriensis]
MDIAHGLATVDLLSVRELPAEGYLVAELQTSGDFHGEGRGAWEETEEQYEADRDGLSERLTGRWGLPHLVSLASTLERSMAGEDIPEPWASLSGHVPDLHLWQLPGTPRWIALGVSQWDAELPFQLLLVVTETDPP